MNTNEDIYGKCPYCGEIKTTLEYFLETNQYNRGISCLPVEIHLERMFSYKVIHKNQYHCYNCGTRWESKSYNKEGGNNMKLKAKIKGKMDVPFYVKKKLDYMKKCSDVFGDFAFYLRISKCYTLKGMRWRIEVPNYTDHDKDLWKALSRTFQYIHDKGCRYSRLEDGLDNIPDIWNVLEKRKNNL